MIPIMQTIFDEAKGNCFEACVASILEIPLDSIPCYKTHTWLTKFNEWLKKEHQMFLLCTNTINDANFNRQMMGAYYIAGGISSRRYAHACVALDGKIIHDPHPSRGGLKILEDYAFFVPCNPAIHTNKD